MKITAEVLGVEILKFHVSAQGFKMLSAFSAAEIAALGFKDFSSKPLNGLVFYPRY